MRGEHMLMLVLVFVLGFMVARMMGGRLIEGDEPPHVVGDKGECKYNGPIYDDQLIFNYEKQLCKEKEKKEACISAHSVQEKTKTYCSWIPKCENGYFFRDGRCIKAKEVWMNCNGGVWGADDDKRCDKKGNCGKLCQQMMTDENGIDRPTPNDKHCIESCVKDINPPLRWCNGSSVRIVKGHWSGQNKWRKRCST